MIGEPILLNPNSYENIDKTLSELKANRKIGDEREWTLLGCGGPPFCIASHMIERNPDKYDWVSVVSGLGHLNMNQVKTFFKMLDKICLGALGKEVLKFSSPKAYDYFLNCKDNHKAWQSFEIILHGTKEEMIRLFLTEFNGEVTILFFLEWIGNTEKNTLKLLSQLFLGYGLGIYIQRIGDRNNDIEVSNAGRYKFFDVFFGFKHPIYREVEYRELQNKGLNPQPIKEMLDNNVTFSTTESMSKCQGGDFILEEKIKKQKGIAPKGIVNSKT